MQRHHHQNIGWILFGLFATLLILWLSKVKAMASVTSQVFTAGLVNASTIVGGIWNSRNDQTTPSAEVGQPPFQANNGTLQCAQGWSLWKDEATGIMMCFKEPTMRRTSQGVMQPSFDLTHLPAPAQPAIRDEGKDEQGFIM